MLQVLTSHAVGTRLFTNDGSATMITVPLLLFLEQSSEVAPVTANVRQLLNSFDKLPEAEQREAATEILRRSLQIEFPPLDDAVLIERAEELFLSLDQQEDSGETA